ncbi:PQ loop repeat-domain-containing protein [Phialemonium atrogriseum]|uniref:PQ loop repeat-domain-containing protein n=1 Tax=Phialemonium atrogriseum TaxID=1093897 RepID=A0AAJ0FI70_9PEZI|nr:PQ loop repeat-domain-containing protein [Phialemonium atrogriseum]KAK1769316.1 PQ loop repeat-domain-containing protein [Phialemonium atrogriseum]
MAPPTAPLNLDVEAISGICGSISIACWVVVFSPQIVENFRRGSADGLSLQFLIVWLLGDVFNILGAVLQGVLPTMVILAIYYTIADIVLLSQCFYYRGFTWRDEVAPPPAKLRTRRLGDPDERTGLLSASAVPLAPTTTSSSSSHEHPHHQAPDWSSNLSHLSPAVPLVNDGTLAFNVWGQVFGWLCAVLYLGSRLPQLLLNWRRKSTEGVSMLFFLFACLGNLTYVLSIFAFEPRCRAGGPGTKCLPGEASTIYGRYMLVNLSWLAGSAGTLLLDMAIFVQFFIYSQADDEDDESEESEDGSDEDVEGNGWDERPVLQRDTSDLSR